MTDHPFASPMTFQWLPTFQLLSFINGFSFTQLCWLNLSFFFFLVSFGDIRKLASSLGLMVFSQCVMIFMHLFLFLYLFILFLRMKFVLPMLMLLSGPHSGSDVPTFTLFSPSSGDARTIDMQITGNYWYANYW